MGDYNFPFIFHISLQVWRTTQSHILLSSFLLQSIVPHQRPTWSNRLVEISDTRCIISAPKQLGTLRIQFGGRLLQIPGFDIPVSLRQSLYCVSFTETWVCERFHWSPAEGRRVAEHWHLRCYIHRSSNNKIPRVIFKRKVQRTEQPVYTTPMAH